MLAFDRFLGLRFSLYVSHARFQHFLGMWTWRHHWMERFFSISSWECNCSSSSNRQSLDSNSKKCQESNRPHMDIHYVAMSPSHVLSPRTRPWVSRRTGSRQIASLSVQRRVWSLQVDISTRFLHVFLRRANSSHLLTLRSDAQATMAWKCSWRSNE